MKLIYLPDATFDLARLRQFIEPHNPGAAARVAKRLHDATVALLEAPDMGRPIEGTPFRRLVVRMRRSAYIIRYRVHYEDDAVVIVRIRHGREQPD